MSSDSGRSISWVMVSFTARSTAWSSMVQRVGPSPLNSGFHSFCQRITMRRGGSISRISPMSATRPSEKSSFQSEPFFQPHSMVASNQYLRTNCESVNVSHSFSGVVRILGRVDKRRLRHWSAPFGDLWHEARQEFFLTQDVKLRHFSTGE